MEQLSYGEFRANLQQSHAGERVPLEVSIEITPRCLLECLRRYDNLPMGSLDANRRGMTNEENSRSAIDRTGVAIFVS